MPTKSSLVAALVLCATAACDDAPLSSAPENLAPANTLLPGAATADRASTGQGGTRPILIQYAVSRNVVDRYEFSAVTNEDGTVRGRFRLREVRYDAKHPRRTRVVVRARGRVVCLNATGNKARLGGVVTRSSFTAGIPIGSTFVWSVTDNGGSGWSSDDTASPLLGGVDPAAYCANGLPYPEKKVERGNITVDDDDLADDGDQ